VEGKGKVVPVLN